jgi:SPP1 gp7 family putative phage head morphogenesis protein
MKINPEYQKLILKIKQDGEKYADRQMQIVYSEQKSRLTGLHQYLGLLYVKHAVDGMLHVSAAQKAAILSDVDKQILSAQKSIGDAEIRTISNILAHNYEDAYYKTAYVLDSGLKTGIKFGMLKQEYIDAAVNSPVKGELFSNRIWNNKAAVADRLKGSFLDALNGGVTIDQIGQELRQTFNVQAYESQRLVHTENARIQSAAIDDIGESAGCVRQMFCATLESNTCAVCAGLDGKYFDIDDVAKPEIPIHPECRCVYINVPTGNWQPQRRRDNETGKNTGYKSYDQWAEEKGIKSSGKIVSPADKSDIITLESNFRDKIMSGGYNLSVNKDLQARHDPQSGRYVNGRSKLSVDAQSLIDKYHGTGRIVIQSPSQPPKEVITADRVIGQYQDQKTGGWIATHKAMIVYSNSGTHVYPVKEMSGND